MVLWIIFSLLTTAAVAAVLWPFLRPAAAATNMHAYDAEVFRDQLREIEADRNRGVLSVAEADAARTEVSRRLLAATRPGGGKAAKKSGERTSTVPALALVCAFMCVPVLSSALYLVFGSPGLSDQPLTARLETPPGDLDVAGLVAKVEARLRDHPQDGRGWQVIAPVYLRQQRYTEAADAYGRALRLLGETPDRLTAYGNALIMANDGVVTEPARKALQKALAVDGSQLRAHFWLAMAYEQDGRFGEAADAWQELLKRGGADAPWRKEVEQRIAAVQSQMNEENQSGMVMAMVSGLAQRLDREGGSLEEWQKLIRSYTVLGDRPAANKALSDARTAFAGKPEALAALTAFASGLGL